MCDETSKFSEAQIAFVLKQAEDGTTVGEICRKQGLVDATFYAWRKKYASLMLSAMRRLRHVEDEDEDEDENATLKRLVAISVSTKPCCRTLCRENSEA